MEISFLEAQINPHFVSNVLNNVTWMAKIQHADNIVPLVQSLNSMLQNVMHQEEDMILLKNELTDPLHYVRNTDAVKMLLPLRFFPHNPLNLLLRHPAAVVLDRQNQFFVLYIRA